MDLRNDWDINNDNDRELIDVIHFINQDQAAYIVRPRTDHINYWNDQEFFNRFRLSKATVRLIHNRIEENLQNRTTRNLDRAVPSLDKLLITLRFLATGDFYITMGDFGGIHKTTAGRIIRSCITAICNLFREVVHLPRIEEEKQETKRNFYNLSHFPRVIGVIDCTHIKIISPGGDNAEVYRNRKGYFSLNCQVVCNAELKITDLVCRWPGSANDSHIFHNSAVKMRFENGDMGNGVLLGDRGYGLQPYLLTPLDEPQNAAENLYNEAQIRTRNVIERMFGIWKRRFPILSIGIRSKIELTQMIIVACAILHNIAREQNEEDFANNELNNVELEENILPAERHGGQLGQNDARMHFIDYFQNLQRNI